MKKPIAVTICIAILACTIIGTANAQKAGFTANSGLQVNPVTIDGKWTTASEWTDAAEYPLSGGLNGIFRLKWWAAEDFSTIYQYFLVEIVSDTTNDAADTVQVCYAAAVELFGTPMGGTTPKTDCWKFEVNGTDPTATLAVSKGTGTAWANFTTWTRANFNASVTIAASPLSATPHKIIEFRIEHISLAINPTTWILVSGYDASNSASGVQVWPTGSSRDVPNDYGLLNSMFEPIPESLSFGIVVLLSSAALIVGSYYLRKRPKTTILTPTKL